MPTAGVLLDRSLGAVGTTPGSAEAYGLYYQWGRKDRSAGVRPRNLGDAFAQAAENSVVNPAFADTHAWKQESGAAVSTLEYAAAHPLSFLSTKVRPEFTTGWPSPAPICGIPRKPATIRAPWGIRCRTAIRGTILRTIRTRYVDGTSEWDGEKYGMTYIFGDLRDWYPTSGYRNRDKGNLAGLATTRTGHYWSNYRSGNTISCFYISKKLSTGKLLQPQSSSKSDAAYGYNVRCCRE